MPETNQQKPDYRLIFILLSGAFISFLSNTFFLEKFPLPSSPFTIFRFYYTKNPHIFVLGFTIIHINFGCFFQNLLRSHLIHSPH